MSSELFKIIISLFFCINCFSPPWSTVRALEVSEKGFSKLYSIQQSITVTKNLGWGGRTYNLIIEMMRTIPLSGCCSCIVFVLRYAAPNQWNPIYWQMECSCRWLVKAHSCRVCMLIHEVVVGWMKLWEAYLQDASFWSSLYWSWPHHNHPQA